MSVQQDAFDHLDKFLSVRGYYVKCADRTDGQQLMHIVMMLAAYNCSVASICERARDLQLAVTDEDCEAAYNYYIEHTGA